MAVTRTVLQCIEGALRLAGMWQIGQTIPPEDSGTALQEMQDMLASWAVEKVMVPSIVEESLTMSAGDPTYTIGKNSADLDTERPEDIISAYIKSGNIDYPVWVIGEREYKLIPDKTVQARPERLNYRPTAPNGTIYLYQTPNAAEDLYFSSVKPFVEPTNLAMNMLNTVQVPRVCHLAIKWNLGLILATENGRPITQVMVREADKSYDNLIALGMSRQVEPARLEITAAAERGNDSILSF